MHEIATAVTCKLCGKIFTTHGAMVIVPGQKNSRIEQFNVSLALHLINGHPQHNKALEEKALEFLGMLRLQNYIIKDKTLRDSRDRLRWSVHQATLNASFSDEKIEAFCDMMSTRCKEIMTDPNVPDAERVPMIKGLMGDILLEVRNELQEPGRYEQAPLVITDQIPAENPR